MRTLTLALTLVLLGITPAWALVVSSVEVDVASHTWCNVGNVAGACATADHPWNLGSGITLNTGQTLVLTQTGGGQGMGGYNFDTSDTCLSNCATPRILINGLSFLDSTRVLAGLPPDPDNTAHNEAQDYVSLGAAGGLGVQVAYADSLHTNPCADANGTCNPDSPWIGNATFFIGQGAGQPNATYPQSAHCLFSAATCFDAGVIAIRAIPEPASILLLSLGFGLTGWTLRRRTGA